MHILCINSGHSSLKFALYRVDGAVEVRVVHGAVERIGLAGGRLWIDGNNHTAVSDRHDDFPTHAAAAAGISTAVRDLGFSAPVAVGHRVVHGGANRTTPEQVDAPMLAELRTLVPFAPLHLPSAILGIEAVASRFPELPQVACFDTAFHRQMPEAAQRFPIPRGLWYEGVRRYGFHGLTFEYIVSTLGPAAKGRLIIAHLGNGASLAAVRDGHPVDTAMEVTPLGPNLKTISERRDDRPHATQAVASFCYQLRKHIGGLTAVLGGLDMLVFTGGIGEHSATLRWEACQGLEYLGITLDSSRNALHSGTISARGSVCTVMVIPANEDLMIARHTRTLLFS